MSLLAREICSLNTKGVHLFENNLFVEAIDSFRLCLDHLVEYQVDKKYNLEDKTNNRDADCEGVEVSVETATSDDIGTNGREPGGDPETKEASPSPFSGWSEPTIKQGQSMESGTPFIFSRAIMVQYDPFSATTDDLTHLHTYKAALHYNLALTQQMLLLTRQSGEPTSSPARIYKHYEAAYHEWKRVKSDENDDHTAVLGLALFNNMGVLFYSEFARFREALECFRAACGVMHDRCHPVLKGEEIYEMSMNAFLVPSEGCPAA